MLKEISPEQINGIRDFADELKKSFKDLPLGEDIIRIIDIQLTIAELSNDLWLVRMNKEYVKEVK